MCAMRAEKPSSTAAWVAVLRGIDTIARPGFADDPCAKDLVPKGWSWALRAAERAAPVVRAVTRGIDRGSEGSSAHMAFRTRAIDQALEDAVEAGIDQIVLLGAGFDARAHRLNCLENAAIIEIDHPATQGAKRARARTLPLAAKSIRYAATDFEGDGLRRAFEAGEHDPARPAAVVWEGVTMYLTREAIDATLALLGEILAPGSRLVVTYYDEASVSRAVWASGQLLRVVGEPLRTRFSSSEIEAVMREHGFSRLSDEGDEEWVPRYFGHPATERTMATSIHERVIVVERSLSDHGIGTRQRSIASGSHAWSAQSICSRESSRGHARNARSPLARASSFATSASSAVAGSSGRSRRASISAYFASNFSHSSTVTGGPRWQPAASTTSATTARFIAGRRR